MNSPFDTTDPDTISRCILIQPTDAHLRNVEFRSHRRDQHLLEAALHCPLLTTRVATGLLDKPSSPILSWLWIDIEEPHPLLGSRLPLLTVHAPHDGLNSDSFQVPLRVTCYARLHCVEQIACAARHLIDLMASMPGGGWFRFLSLTASLQLYIQQAEAEHSELSEAPTDIESATWVTSSVLWNGDKNKELALHAFYQAEYSCFSCLHLQNTMDRVADMPPRTLLLTLFGLSHVARFPG